MRDDLPFAIADRIPEFALGIGNRGRAGAVAKDHQNRILPMKARPSLRAVVIRIEGGSETRPVRHHLISDDLVTFREMLICLWRRGLKPNVDWIAEYKRHLEAMANAFLFRRA